MSTSRDDFCREILRDQAEALALYGHPQQEIIVPKFQRSELDIGRELGKGSFGVVKELRGITPAETTNNSSDVMKLHRKRLERYCRSDHDGLAVKFLKKGSRMARLDLANECMILSSIHHPNIVAVRGALDTHDPFQEGYFFIMERIYETLAERIKYEWNDSFVLTMSDGLIPGLSPAWNESSASSMSNVQSKLMSERLQVGHDLALALQYLHANKIVYRDLKPENVGFDAFGSVKLFDFGLAKALHPKLQDGGLYKLTALTGSMPYMAPEVALKQHYNETCDVHSYGILLWEILALESAYIPFTEASRHDFYQRFLHGSERPPIPESWPFYTRHALEGTWCVSPHERLRFQEISLMIQTDMYELTSRPVHREDDWEAFKSSKLSRRQSSINDVAA